MLAFAGVCLLSTSLHASPAGTSATAGTAQPQVEPPPAAEREAARQGAQHGQRIELSERPVLDAAIFTEISPYSASQNAVRLPDDQRLD
jgi:hypothetical protein